MMIILKNQHPTLTERYLFKTYGLYRSISNLLVDLQGNCNTSVVITLTAKNVAFSLKGDTI